MFYSNSVQAMMWVAALGASNSVEAQGKEAWGYCFATQFEGNSIGTTPPFKMDREPTDKLQNLLNGDFEYFIQSQQGAKSGGCRVYTTRSEVEPVQASMMKHYQGRGLKIIELSWRPDYAAKGEAKVPVASSIPSAGKLTFILLRNIGVRNGINAWCFSAPISVPGPAGWPSGPDTDARKIISNYYSAFEQSCAKYDVADSRTRFMHNQSASQEEGMRDILKLYRSQNGNIEVVVNQ